MTLIELLSADINTLRQYALVFEDTLAQSLTIKWQEHGSTNCVPSPILLTNGKHMLSADILSEVHPGGLLYNMWINSDLNAIAAGTEIMSWEDAITLIPQQEE